MAKAGKKRKAKSTTKSRTKAAGKSRTKLKTKAQPRTKKKSPVRAGKRAMGTASQGKVYPVPAAVAKVAHIDARQYKSLYARSVKNPDVFWAEQAKQFVTWSKPWTKVSDWSYKASNLHIKWFIGGKLNVSYNCLDRHLTTRGNQTAIIWEGDDPKDDKKITYRELHTEVCKLANVLKSRGVK